MQLGMYSIYDKKAEAFTQPFFQATRGLAIRAFTDACNMQDNQFAKHPEDYTLFLIGTFDDETGVLAQDVVPVPLMPAVECYKQGI